MASVPEDLHINVPELLSRRRRLSDAFVTGLMWAVYTYLWAPLLSLFAWILGFEFAYDVMIRSGGLQGLKKVLVWYGIMLGCICIVVTGWSLINRLRFSGHERRMGAKIVDDNALASCFGVDSTALRQLRNARVMRLSLGEDGNIQNINPTELPQRRLHNEESQLKKPTKIAG